MEAGRPPWSFPFHAPCAVRSPSPLPSASSPAGGFAAARACAPRDHGAGRARAAGGRRRAPGRRGRPGAGAERRAARAGPRGGRHHRADPQGAAARPLPRHGDAARSDGGPARGGGARVRGLALPRAGQPGGGALRDEAQRVPPGPAPRQASRTQAHPPCDRKNMVPLYDPEAGESAADARVCIDPFEFPDIACE